MFDLSFDPAIRVLSVTVSGLWTVGDLATFSTTALARVTATRVRHGQFAILVDARGMPVQIPLVAKGLEMMSVKAFAIAPGPVTLVASSMLGKMQADRIMKASDVRVFLDIDEAREWLASVWEPAGSATSLREIA